MSYQGMSANKALLALWIGVLAAPMLSAQPVAEHSLVLLNQNSSEIIELVASNYEGGPGPITVEILSQPTHGTLVEIGFLTYQYTPDPDYYGGDKFRWGIHDGAQYSDLATCKLGINRIPQIHDQTVHTNQATTLRIKVTGSDDGRPGPYTATIVQPPANGTLVEVTWREFDYVPDPEFFGSDSVVWFVNDGMVDSNSATVSLEVNQRPVANPQAFVVPPGLNLVNWLDVTDDDFPEPITVEVGEPANGTVTVLDSEGRFEYTPDPGFSGSDEFSWRAFDGQVHSDWSLVTLEVQPPVTTALQVGISFPLGDEGGSFDHRAFNTQHFAALNVNRFRTNLGDWHRVERVEGSYEWSGIDETLTWALENGYTVFFTIPAKTPEWHCDFSKQHGALCVPLDMVDFTAFVDALMLHLVEFETENGSLPISAIAFGNEWSDSENLVSYPGTKEDYEAQQNEVYDAVQEHLPQIPVALGGMSGGSTRTYAYCKGYLEIDEVFSRESYCPQDFAVNIIETTDYVLQNARYDVLDQHLYEYDADWPHMLTALINEALPVEKRSIPIVASEFGGPRGDIEVPDEETQAAKLTDYFDQLVQLPIGEALFYRLVEVGGETGETYRYSGLIDRELFDLFVEGGSPAIEKLTYWVYQARALEINP